MYRDEYDLFSIKQFENLFLIDDINCDDFMAYIPDNVMDELLKYCYNFKITIQMHDSNDIKKFDINVINHIKDSDFYYSTTIVTKNKILPDDLKIKIKFYFKSLKDKANFKIKFTEYNI